MKFALLSGLILQGASAAFLVKPTEASHGKKYSPNAPNDVAKDDVRLSQRKTNHTDLKVHYLKAPAFRQWYADHSEGRGLWKWGQSLDAYQFHLSKMSGKINLMEVGVQSGGSIEMWKANLGPELHYFGVDIDTRCMAFEDASTKIFIGDQGQAATWQHLFQNGMPSLNVAIDDGGHLPIQMLTTLQQVWPHMLPGGVFAVEDIHGMNDDYISKFFYPAADALASQPALLESVHIYPFNLVVVRQGGSELSLPAPATTVASVVDLNAALPNNLGKVVALQNEAWPSMLTADGLKTLFHNFYELHTGDIQMQPEQCFWQCKEFPCTMHVINNKQQNLVKGVHIFKQWVLVEVAAEPPVIDAPRKGKIWHENVCEKAPQDLSSKNGNKYEGYR